jgi:hypothetical protein
MTTKKEQKFNVRRTNHDLQREQKIVIRNKSRLHEEQKFIVRGTNHEGTKFVIWNKSRLHEQQKFSPRNKSRLQRRNKNLMSAEQITTYKGNKNL